MKTKEMIDLISAKYAERVRIYPATLEQKIHAVKKVRNVFKGKMEKPILFELINIMFQPNTEEVFFNSVSSIEKTITVHTQRGFGLPIDNDQLLEILSFVESAECRSTTFCNAIGKKLDLLLKELK